MDPRLAEFLDRCLLLDLETGPNGALREIGAVRGDETFVREGRFGLDAGLAALDRFAAGSDYLLGHNLLGHDLPHLQARAPFLALLRRPAVDTLYLSPLAFPEYPYHRLVKDYKLVRDALSDPVADARLARRVFVEQWVELGRHTGAVAEGLVPVYRFCFQGATGLAGSDGGGKSLCFQLPALVRNLRRGALTVVISPLQAIMKDQVDNLARKTGTTAAVALYGMLTPPERGEVLERVRLGDAAILYVSPEQLRDASFRSVLETREIGCWVFDEAHCLSKWGHDFRPDYLYAGRFIEELAARQGAGVPPVACFTATAKRDVTAEILAYFRDRLGLGLELFEGGVERENLSFEVQVAPVMEKPGWWSATRTAPMPCSSPCGPCARRAASPGCLARGAAPPAPGARDRRIPRPAEGAWAGAADGRGAGEGRGPRAEEDGGNAAPKPTGVIADDPGNPWRAAIGDLVRAWRDEAGGAEVPAARILEFCYETLAEQRRDRSLGEGVLLSTLHGAKGMEIPHVPIADGDWGPGAQGPGQAEEGRRLLYVGMTRARETLALGRIPGDGNPWLAEIAGDWVLRLRPRVAAPAPEVIVALLRRRREDGEVRCREGCQSETWEVPLVELRLKA